MNFTRLNREFHRWGSIVTLVPIGIIVVTGVILQLKKNVAWIQPPTRAGASDELRIRFDEILRVVQQVPEAEVDGWDDVDRLDVRPGKGMVKVRCKNRWEVQLDSRTGDILQVAYRRSDLLESIHDGSYFHDHFKLWVFLPSGLALIMLWLTGVYLFFLPYFLPYLIRRKRRL